MENKFRTSECNESRKVPQTFIHATIYVLVCIYLIKLKLRFQHLKQSYVLIIV